MKIFFNYDPKTIIPTDICNKYLATEMKVFLTKEKSQYNSFNSLFTFLDVNFYIKAFYIVITWIVRMAYG